MKKRVLIVGAGWYGCYTATTLLKRYGDTLDLQMYDLTGDIFGGSSSRNQNRLHLGYHYPRSYRTRKECRDGYEKFLKTFPDEWSYEVEAFYAVDDQSLMDFVTYTHIFHHEGGRFEAVKPNVIPLTMNDASIDGVIITHERAIDFRRIQDHYRQQLSHLLVQEAPCHDDYDVVLDCTYGHLYKDVDQNLMETCVSLVYQFHGEYPYPFGVTIMDGPSGFSIYPYNREQRLFTITHVTHTPLCHGVVTPDQAVVDSARERIEKAVTRLVPTFSKDFTYHSYFISYKCKPPRHIHTDDRSLKATTRKQTTSDGPRCLSIYGGKITGIFEIDAVLDQVADWFV